MAEADLPLVTEWARREGFCPGIGDAGIYRHTDAAGVWVGCLGDQPVGCIAGIRYDAHYGFIGLFLVRPEHRGQGYGVALWHQAMEHLAEVACIGVEAAPEREGDYACWGFRPASRTVRWHLPAAARPRCVTASLPQGHRLVAGGAVKPEVVQAYDARHEATPRPHFLSEWLAQRAGEVLVALDPQGCCRGFGRIRPCLLPEGDGRHGWRIGPLLADAPPLAGGLLEGLCSGRAGPVLIDAPETNPRARRLLEERGFRPGGHTIRMYRGTPPQLPDQDIYGLACLELG
jgi:ribosomal-protein-alanine N-acetyltransferase